MSRFSDGARARLYSGTAVSLLICGDVAALLFALIFSLQLHFDHLGLTQIFSKNIAARPVSTAVAMCLYIGVFAAFRLYRYAWRFASLEMVWGVAFGNALGLALLIGTQRLIDGGTFPAPVFAIFYAFGTLIVGAVRILLRLSSLGRSYGGLAIRLLERNLRPKRVVILGSGCTGARLLNALRDEIREPYNVIGFLDNDADRVGRYIRDVRVIGKLDRLYSMLAEKSVDEVLFALPNAAGMQIREYIVACRQHQIPVKIIPALQDVLNGRSQAHLEDVSVEDLLRRPQVNIKTSEIGAYITGRRVLVTGAGGSIGSELCRQIMPLNPSKLILMGHGENSIHGIYQELRRKFPDYLDRFVVVIGSVADETRVDQVFRENLPQVVFHAAAHKHVPIMESNLIEAVQNNVLGTNCVLEACGRYGIKRVVLISSDKAVHPSCIMGATKWMGEELLRAVSYIYPQTTYVSVRFGNVLGSRGSVVPLFQEQIRRGGPVTVTHPDMTRYFMLIPEAVQLVLQAGAVGSSGELYLLDMGEPVKILDLAYDMIRLSGFEPETDIPVAFTGIRPGEKLHEELSRGDEVMEAVCQGLSVVRRQGEVKSTAFVGLARRLREAVASGDTRQMQDCLDEVIPGFGTRTLLKNTMPKVEALDPTPHV